MRYVCARKHMCSCYCCMGTYDARGSYDANSSSAVKECEQTRCCDYAMRSDKGSEDKGRRLNRYQKINRRTETQINQISHHTLMTCRSPNMLLGRAISSYEWRPPSLVFYLRRKKRAKAEGSKMHRLPCSAGGPVPLVLDIRIAHKRFGSSSDPSINGHLHYPNDVDRSLNVDKIRTYR
jgi:hypothetical protein